MRPIEAIAAALLVGLIGLVLTSVFWRYVLGSPITAADEIASFMFLWIVMFGAVIAIDRNEHLRLALLVNAAEPRTRRILEAVGLIMATFLAAPCPRRSTPISRWTSSRRRSRSRPPGASPASRSASPRMLIALAAKLRRETSVRDVLVGAAIVAAAVAACG